MNFNYSYRAFLLTSLIFGCFFLILYSIKLRGHQAVEDDFAYDVELIPEELLDVEDEPEESEMELAEIETNRAYNEAEKYISQTETFNRKNSEDIEEKLREIDEAISRAGNGDNSFKNTVNASSVNNQLNPEISKTESSNKGVNRRTTVSYMLKDRNHLHLPNPVYTCEGSGKIVINIEVNALGDVKKTSFNRNASTTNNQCLIDAAQEYAAQARFTSDASRQKQLGTITFNFPGQH